MLSRRAAERVAKPSDYIKAEENAWKEVQRAGLEAREAFPCLSGDDRNKIRNSTYIPWIEELTASHKPHWGLVCFRTSYGDEEAWSKYREHLKHSTRIAFYGCTWTDFLLTNGGLNSWTMIKSAWTGLH